MKKGVEPKVIDMDAVQNGRSMAANVFHISRMNSASVPIIYIQG